MISAAAGSLALVVAPLVKEHGVDYLFAAGLLAGLFQLAFGFGLSTDDTQQLLKVAQEAPLHPKIKRDAVIAYGLHKGLSLMDVQQALYDTGLPILGGRRNA